MSPWIWITVFFLVVGLENTRVLYLKATEGNRPARAAAAGGMYHLFTAAIVLAYTDDARYLTASFAGTLVGIYIAVRRQRRKEAKAEREAEREAKRSQSCLRQCQKPPAQAGSPEERLVDSAL